MIIKKKNKTNLIKLTELKFLKTEITKIETGDSIKIKKIIQEGNKERIQVSDGVVIAKKNSGINQTITLRKTIQNIGVEKIYLVHSPKIVKIEVIKKARVRRAKLYYLRLRSGKATRLKQKIV
uniref:Large ribosomal subunit protein bL19c n=1 Tax=Tolypiocladia glomerulata TaxID=860646 RepID=A0A1Z1MV81_9FLOR|nr:ribosomal protein L19 [Tolypiocladia glomerulata]ARW69819.1 ribosomal protein L19 [Tolypiocladia glomerulata]